jgi:hypothetical protein
MRGCLRFGGRNGFYTISSRQSYVDAHGESSHSQQCHKLELPSRGKHGERELGGMPYGAILSEETSQCIEQIFHRTQI